jgi:hypothetical protein
MVYMIDFKIPGGFLSQNAENINFAEKWNVYLILSYFTLINKIIVIFIQINWFLAIFCDFLFFLYKFYIKIKNIENCHFYLKLKLTAQILRDWEDVKTILW